MERLVEHKDNPEKENRSNPDILAQISTAFAALGALDLRICQVFEGLRTQKGGDLFYVENSELAKLIIEYYGDLLTPTIKQVVSGELRYRDLIEEKDEVTLKKMAEEMANGPLRNS